MTSKSDEITSTSGKRCNDEIERAQRREQDAKKHHEPGSRPEVEVAKGKVTAYRVRLRIT